MKTVLFGLLLSIIATSAKADNIDKLEKAMNIGQLIGIAEACDTPINTPAVLGYFMENDLMSPKLNAAFETAKSVSKMDKPSVLSCEVNALTVTKMQLD